MKTTLLLLIGLILFNCKPQSTNDQLLLEERIARIENGLMANLQIQYGDSIIQNTYTLKERMKELTVPGISIAVLNEGEIEWAKGYGIADSLENRAVTTETLFQAASISKPLAATRALQLVEKGIIDLDENVNSYLKNWRLPDNEFTTNEKVTLRRVLNHTAGLTVWGFPGYANGESIPTIPDILEGKGNTEEVRVYKEPGEGWRYSGGGYTVMQQMITDVEGEDFAEIMEKNVLEPLGMESSTYVNPLPDEKHHLAATGHYSDGNMVEGRWHIYPEQAAAGLWTSPSELILWGQEIQKILQTQEDGLLKAKTVNEMLTPNEDSQGLGPYVLDLSFGHGGANEGFRAELLIWKEQPNAVVMMTNSDNGSSLMREVMLSIVREYDLPDYSPRKRVYEEQTQEQLARFVGQYDLGERGPAKIIVQNDGLRLTGDFFTGNVLLLPESDSTFFNRESGTLYNFKLVNSIVSGFEFSGIVAEKVNAFK